MNVKQIIPANPSFSKYTPKDDYLNVSEFFCDSIQGEGINIGHPATFMRLQECVLGCSWCDTEEVWRYGNPYSFEELFALMEGFNVIKKLHDGQHLVITGGSPLLQERELTKFLVRFSEKYDFYPYIEIENECYFMPKPEFMLLVDCWNNSPKLSNSGNSSSKRYKPEIIKQMSQLENSWFKFVIGNRIDWGEIISEYVVLDLIKKEQIILMPQGATRLELEKNREFVIDLAIENNVRYCTREHIVAWDKKTGI